MKTIILTSVASFVISDVIKRNKSLTEKNNLVFINTPAEGEKGDKQWLTDDKKALEEAGFKVSEYTITSKNEAELRKDLASFDIVYVSGGNTFYFLEKAQESGFINVVKDFVLKDEKIYMGTSAGSIVAGPDIYPVVGLDDASKAPNLKEYEGFDLVDFVIMPHWGSENFKDRYMNTFMKTNYNNKNKIIPLNDNQYVLVKDNLYEIIDVSK